VNILLAGMLRFRLASARSSIRAIRGAAMTIHRLLQNSALRQDEIANLVEAYERTLRKLNLVERNDPITQMVAQKIIEIGQRGIRDPKQLSTLAIKELGVE
jgi:hypothetical protein